MCELIAAFASGAAVVLFIQWRRERNMRRQLTIEAIRLVKMARLKGIDINLPDFQTDK